MNKSLLLSLTIILGAFPACSAKQQASKPVPNAPDRDALAHFCKQMAQGPSGAITALPATQRQTAWMSEMAEAATSANIRGWASFQSTLIAHPPNKKQAWLELGVTTHGLQTECAVILKKQP